MTQQGEIGVGELVRLGVHTSGRTAALEATMIARVGLFLIFDSVSPAFVAKPGMTLVVEPLVQGGRRGWATITDIQFQGSGLRITTSEPRWDNERGGRADRQQCSLPVRITWSDGTSRPPQKTLGDILDVSATGARLRLRKTIPELAVVMLEIYTDPNKDPMVCTAQVCRHISGSAASGVEMGVKFADCMDGMILVSEISRPSTKFVA